VETVGGVFGSKAAAEASRGSDPSTIIKSRATANGALNLRLNRNPLSKRVYIYPFMFFLGSHYAIKSTLIDDYPGAVSHESYRHQDVDVTLMRMIWEEPPTKVMVTVT
jgi:hypothetical protein